MFCTKPITLCIIALLFAVSSIVTPLNGKGLLCAAKPVSALLNCLAHNNNVLFYR